MKTNLLAVAVTCAIAGAGCAPKDSQSPEPSQKQVERNLDTSEADCTGHFVFDTASSGSGKSTCRDGGGISYTAQSDAPVPTGLSCDYTVRYTSAKNSNGLFFCSDGSHGELSVTDRPHGGTAVAQAQDGRSFSFTFKY